VIGSSCSIVISPGLIRVALPAFDENVGIVPERFTARRA
jgi:hypothetical protein